MAARSEQAFERIGEFLELRLPTMHAAGAALAVTIARRSSASSFEASPTPRAERRSARDAVQIRVDLEVVSPRSSPCSLPRPESSIWMCPSRSWFRGWSSNSPSGRSRCHHLLTHTSGLPIGHEEVGVRARRGVRLRERVARFPPGERFWYSNDGYKLVGVVLETSPDIPCTS